MSKPCQRSRRPLIVEGVAQAPEALAGVVLRVGSKTPKVIARPGHALLGLGAPRAFHGHHSERRPGFRAGLCATPTTTTERTARSLLALASRAKEQRRLLRRDSQHRCERRSS